MSTGAETDESVIEPVTRRRKARRALVFLITAGAGFVLSLLVSTALSRPAGAATLPVGVSQSGIHLPQLQTGGQGLQAPGGQGTTLRTALSAGTPGPALPAATPSNGLDPSGIVSPAPRAIGVVQSQMPGGLTAVAPNLGSLVPIIPAPGSVASGPGSAGSRAQPAPPGPVQPVNPVSLAAGARTPSLMGPSGPLTAQGPKARDRSPLVPDRAPARPVLPHTAPLTANESGDSMPSGSGAAPFGSLPPTGSLLPALVAGGAILAAMRARRLLLDLRYSPPG